MTITKLPKKARYTNADIIEHILELHECVEKHVGKFDKHVEIVGMTFGSVRTDIARLQGQVEVLVAGKVLPLPEPPKTDGFFAKLRKVSTIEAIVIILAAIAGSGNVVKLFDVIWKWLLVH